MKRICDNCDKAEYHDWQRNKKIPATCDLWEAIYGDNSIPSTVEVEIKHDFHLDVELSIVIKECKGFEP